MSQAAGFASSFSLHGVGVGRGVAIGRAVVVSGKAEIKRYFIQPSAADAEINRVMQARAAAIAEVQRVLDNLPDTVPHELPALLEVHLMLLQDEGLFDGVREWIGTRHYNAAWALSSQFERLERQFDEMEDPYLRERKADLEQVINSVIERLQSGAENAPQAAHDLARSTAADDAGISDLVLVSHDLSPMDMLHFRQDVFAGFVTDVGGKDSHTAIVARSMGIPAVVGARHASKSIRSDDIVVIDAEKGMVLLNPSAEDLAAYRTRRQQVIDEQKQLQTLLHMPAVTADGQKIELLANIELPGDTADALAAGAEGVGLFRSEFLFMGRQTQQMPTEQEQYEAYLQALQGMQGLPLTIRTIDVGADKPLRREADGYTPLNPALGLRAIRWSLSEPDMFLTQLRAILRTAAHSQSPNQEATYGQVKVLVPMLAHESEIQQTLALLDKARQQLREQGLAYGDIQIGAMIEVPAAALIAPVFLQYFDFLSIGTNDLTQYTLAIDRTDESVAHLYDPLHPAVLYLLKSTIQAAHAAGKPVSVCGEMAGDPAFTQLLLNMGLRSFSMHPSQILAIKQEVLRSTCITQ